MVDLIGIEPMTSSMPWKRAPSCATGPLCRDATFLLSPVERDSSNMGRPGEGSLDGIGAWSGDSGQAEGQGTGDGRTGIALSRRNLGQKTYVTGNTLGVFRCLR
jgi:hypothetical protein